MIKNILHARHPSKNYLAMDNLDFLQTIGAYQIDRRGRSRELKMTVACLLFFGKYNAIRQKFPHFHLEYLNHRNCQGKERWSDRVCTGDLEYAELNIFSFFQLLREKLRATINDGGSVAELEEATGLTKYQVRKILSQFIEQGIVTQTGRARATRYYCTPSIIERADIADKFRRTMLYQPAAFLLSMKEGKSCLPFVRNRPLR